MAQPASADGSFSANARARLSSWGHEYEYRTTIHGVFLLGNMLGNMLGKEERVFNLGTPGPTDRNRGAKDF